MENVLRLSVELTLSPGSSLARSRSSAPQGGVTPDRLIQPAPHQRLRLTQPGALGFLDFTPSSQGHHSC